MKLAELLSLGAALGADTHGVVHARDLRRAGADPSTVQLALREQWQRLLRGVYLTRRGPVDEVVQAHAAVQHAGAGAVVTGLVACRWHGLPWVPSSDRVQVLVPGERRRLSTGFVDVRRSSALDVVPVSVRHGLPVAGVSQAVVDACRDVPALREVRGLVLGAVAGRRCTTQQLRDLLDVGAVAGTALTRRACLDAERGAASPPEAELADGLLGTGVPFCCNAEVWLDGELLGVVDAWLVGTGTGAELDSAEWHGSTDLLDATLRRDRRFRQAGLELVHVTPGRYRREPEAFHSELLAAAAARQRAGTAEPPGLVVVPRGPLLRGRPGPSYRRAA